MLRSREGTALRVGALKTLAFSSFVLVPWFMWPASTLYAATAGTPEIQQTTNTALQGDSAPAKTDNQGQLEEVVVTAEKRREPLQEVPISAEVVSGQSLATQNLSTLAELSDSVPGLNVVTGNFVDILSIRGVSSGANASFDQSVATFVDDVYHGRSVASEATFLDLDRIEVLKGPQSTFFGNNAIAGALNIVTKKPGNTFDASARLLYGMFGQYAAEAAVTLPLSSQFSIRFAALADGGRGWIKNVNTGEDAPDSSNKAARITALFKPDDNLDFTLKVEGSRNQSSGSVGLPGQWYNCPLPQPLPATQGAFSSCAQAASLGVPIGLNRYQNAGIAGQGTYLSTLDETLTVNYRRWGLTFTSVSGFSNYSSNEDVDSGQVPVPTATTTNPEKYHQFSQELRIASDTGGTVDYMAGLYFQTDRVNFEAETNVPAVDFIASVPGFTALAPYLPVAALQGFAQNEKVYSAFGSLGWNITQDLKFTAGLRGSWVNKDATGILSYGQGTQTYDGFVPTPLPVQQLAGALFLGQPGVHELSISSHAPMPSAGLKYQLSPTLMTYLTYSRGFLAGGINAQNGLGEPQKYQYEPEYVNAFELGMKSTWFDNRLLMNVDLFLSNYNNLQVTQVIYHPADNFYSNEVGNAAMSRSQGVEMETQWAISRAFRVKANVTYLESYYVSYPSGPPTTLAAYCSVNYVTPYCSSFPNPVPQSYNFTGKPTVYSPRWSGSVTGSYTLPLQQGYTLTTDVIPFFSSKYWAGGFDDIVPEAPAYVRLDARISLASPDERWMIDLIGKNLTDKVVIESAALNQAQIEERRNVALQFRYHF